METIFTFMTIHPAWTHFIACTIITILLGIWEHPYNQTFIGPMSTFITILTQGLMIILTTACTQSSSPYCYVPPVYITLSMTSATIVVIMIIFLTTYYRDLKLCLYRQFKKLHCFGIIKWLLK